MRHRCRRSYSCAFEFTTGARAAHFPTSSPSRQVDGEGRAFAQNALEGHAPAVVLGDMPNDAQAQTRPAGLLGAGLVHPVETLENTFEVLLGNAYARVRDAYDDLVLVRASGDLHTPAAWGVLHGVLHEVGEHGSELCLVAPDGVRRGLAGAFPGKGDVLLAVGRTQAGEHPHQDAP